MNLDYCEDCNIAVCNNTKDCDRENGHGNQGKEVISIKEFEDYQVEYNILYPDFKSGCNICHNKTAHSIDQYIKKYNINDDDYNKISICCQCASMEPQIKKDIKIVLKYINELVLDPSRIVAEYWADDIENGIIAHDNKFASNA
jgi:hypothetical protein